ncbi:LysR family transcriptional regulator [Cupriavidus consociatus]|uniref:LysR family transcriptional regulator n=1 Tax=Cupriavidus consociatus TaxID=2821357 RepID=UPI001AE48F0A|nr:MULTISPECIES: LysR substrate-binding domain-containing protein [unclassified Cupriavidus]MBP0624058.1 LysR family transcriptional regulator [Cupriavidus sp. LEh25]MDK2660767.1 LysR substrate-binding domain-containing protein [Cupriavidus sp. LEh21]
MDLKSLRYFVAVAEAQSVGKAAERLHMAQPPLSVQIRNLETQLGTALFVRESTGMRLTDAGSALFARAREALALANEGFEAARAVASGRRGRLSVGYMFSLGYAVLPKLVPQLRRSLPDVELQFVEMSTATYEAHIVDHKVTLGLCMPPIQRPDVTTTIVGMQPLRLALPARAPLARLASVPVARLQGQRLIALPTLKDGADTSMVAALLRRHQVTMQIVERVETVHAALALVLAGEGYAIVPACAEVGRPPGVVFRKLRDAAEAFEVAVCRRSDLESPFIEPFITAARHALR